MRKKEVLFLILLLLIPSVAAVGMWFVRVLLTGSLYLGFILWNLILAWLPLLLALAVIKFVSSYRLIHYKSIGSLLLWLVLLPNSFYVVTDFIHLRNFNNRYRLLDIVILLLFSIAGLALGYVSLLLVHRCLEKRVHLSWAHWFAGAVLLLSSFAIYLGRHLRWNSWDVLFQPSGIIFDVSNRLLYPAEYPDTFTTTILFFAFLSALYVPLWLLSHAVSFNPSNKQR